MYKFEIGQLVRDEDMKLYKVEDTGVDGNGQVIYLLKECFPKYVYKYEKELEACHGKVVNEIEFRPW